MAFSKPQKLWHIAIITGICCLVFNVSYAQYDTLWENQFPEYYSYSNEMASTADGGYLLAVENDEPEIIKINSNGELVWNKVFPTESNTRPSRTIIRTYDNHFLVGGESIVKINGNGDIIWEIEHKATAIELTQDGGFIVGSTSVSNKGADNPECNNSCLSDYDIKRFDVNGNLIWQKLYGGSREESISDIQKLDDGTFLIGGTSWSDAGFDKSENSRGPDPNSDDYEWDYWVLKIDGNGNIIWDKTYGGNALDGLKKIIPTSDGNFILAGNSWSGVGYEKSQNARDTDIWIIKINSNGDILWDKTFGTGDVTEISTIIETSDHGLLLGGWTWATFADHEKSEEGSGTWIIRTDQFGNKLYDKTYPTYFEFGAMKNTPEGGFLLAMEGSGAYNLIHLKETDELLSSCQNIEIIPKNDCGRVIFSFPQVENARRYRYKIKQFGEDQWRETTSTSEKDYVYNEEGRVFIDLQYPLASQQEYLMEIETEFLGNTFSRKTLIAFITNGDTQSPSNLISQAITNESAEITWDQDECNEFYQYRLRELYTSNWYNSATRNQDVNHQVLTPENIRLLNLNPSTTYEWQVRTVYAHRQLSDWSEIASFTTTFDAQLNTRIDREAIADIKTNLTYYPNPVKDFLHIQLETPIKENTTLEIYDMAGVLKISENASLEIGENNITLDLRQVSTNANQLILKVNLPSRGNIVKHIRRN